MSVLGAKKYRFFPLLAALAALLALALASLVPIPASAAYSTSVSGANTTLTFGLKGSIETFIVPDNVSEITIRLAGGEGGQALLSPRDITKYLVEPMWRTSSELDAMFFQGDSVVFEGIKIEAYSIGKNSDVVRVTKVN
jgi:hypothetical protein